RGCATRAAALGAQSRGADSGASVGLSGTQVSRTCWPLKVPPLQWSAKWLLRSFEHISGPRFKRGPEDEPIGLVLESMRWHGLFGRFGERDNNWWAGLSAVQVPLLAVAAAGDHQDPVWACRELFEQIGSAHRQFLCPSREHGFSEDFDHVQMLVSKAAQQQVWPRVIEWLGERSVPEQVAEFQVAVGS
ncbi:alpha/beta hydrolase, partial [Pseudomonas syringae]